MAFFKSLFDPSSKKLWTVQCFDPSHGDSETLSTAPMERDAAFALAREHDERYHKGENTAMLTELQSSSSAEEDLMSFSKEINEE